MVVWQGTGSWWWYFIRPVGKAYVRLQFSQELVNWRLWKPNIPFTHCNHAIINYIPQWRDSERRTKSTRWLRRIPKPPSQSLGNMNRSAALWQQWSCDHSTWLRLPGFLSGLNIHSCLSSQFSVHMSKKLKDQESSIASTLGIYSF